MRDIDLTLTVREIQIIRSVLLQTITQKAKHQKEVNLLEEKLQNIVEGK